MPRNEKRLHLPSPDQLSNLAIQLIIDILNRLSFQDVVRTSTLCMDWKYICRRTPQVKFDQTAWETPEDLTSPITPFNPILNCFFSFHIRTIFKVTLDISSQKVCHNVYRLIDLLETSFIQTFSS